MTLEPGDGFVVVSKFGRRYIRLYVISHRLNTIIQERVIFLNGRSVWDKHSRLIKWETSEVNLLIVVGTVKWRTKMMSRYDPIHSRHHWDKVMLAHVSRHHHVLFARWVCVYKSILTPEKWSLSVGPWWPLEAVNKCLCRMWVRMFCKIKDAFLISPIKHYKWFVLH